MVDQSEEEKNKEWNAYIGELMKTKGYTKVWAYFLRIIRTEEFVNAVVKLRAEYKIPPQGFSDSAGVSSRPDEWAYRDDFSKSRELDEEIDKLCRKYGLYFVIWGTLIRWYLLYNKAEGSGDAARDGSLVTFADLFNEWEEPFMSEIQEANARLYPLGIRISPFATERDIIEYVRKTYKTELKPYLDRYVAEHKLVNIGRFRGRKKTVQDRDDFIYENRKLPQKKIKALVREKFGVNLDYPYIGKIVSRERKHRQKA